MSAVCLVLMAPYVIIEYYYQYDLIGLQPSRKNDGVPFGPFEKAEKFSVWL